MTRDHLNALNDLIQRRLSDIEDAINGERENVKALTLAHRDLLRTEVEQEIDQQRQAVETQKSQSRSQLNDSSRS